MESTPSSSEEGTRIWGKGSDHLHLWEKVISYTQMFATMLLHGDKICMNNDVQLFLIHVR